MFKQAGLVPYGAAAAAAFLMCLPPETASAQFLYITGAETRPEGSGKIQQSITRRSDKEYGDYTAHDLSTSVEYGFANSFTGSAAIKLQSMDTSGLLVPGYLPGDEEYALDFFGLEIGGKHKFLSTAIDPIGLAAFWKGSYSTLDKHSGKSKKVYGLESGLALQKYFLEGQLTWRATAAVKAIHATRGEVANRFTDEGAQYSADVVANGRPLTLFFPDSEQCDDDAGEDFYSDPPVCFEWPNFAEMEIELKFATGISYRIMNNWYVSLEALYEEEYETEVNRERFSLFVGPGLHFEGQAWGVSLGWIRQINGGGEKIDPSDELHFIEKTKDEIRLKVSYNF